MAAYLKSTLPFTLLGDVTPGCRYVTVTWKKGSSQKRRVASCHRKVAPARDQIKLVRSYYQKQLLRQIPGASMMFGEQQVGLYDLKTGKKVKG